MKNKSLRDAALFAAAGALCAGAVTTGATILGVAPWAHADVASTGHYGDQGDNDAVAFWQDVTTAGNMTGTVATAEHLAQSICLSLDRGQTEDQIITAGMRATGLDFTSARYAVHSAEFHFCDRWF